MTSQPIGPVLDALGVTISLDPDQQVTEALVIAKVADFNTGRSVLGLFHSDGLDWISQAGLLAAARHVMSTAEVCDDDDNDD